MRAVSDGHPAEELLSAVGPGLGVTAQSSQQRQVQVEAGVYCCSVGTEYFRKLRLLGITPQSVYEDFGVRVSDVGWCDHRMLRLG